jgi:hypothetical protein
MLGPSTYLLYHVERPRTVAEWRAQDVARGEVAASLGRRWAAMTSALVRRSRREAWACSRGGAAVAISVPAPGAQRRVL